MDQVDKQKQLTGEIYEIKMGLWLIGKHLASKQLSRRSLQQLKSIYLNNQFSNQLNNHAIHRLLSTSKVNFAHDPLPPIDPKKYGGDGQVVLDPDYRLRPPPPKSVADFADPDSTGHWSSYGFDEVDRKLDRQWAHISMFFFCTVFMTFITAYFYYEPDHLRLNEWVSREGFLELGRREKHGLPLVDPDYVPREKMLASLPAEKDIDIDVHL